MKQKEIWKRIPGFNQNKYYISNFGNVKNSKGHIMHPTYNRRTGYMQVTLSYAPGKPKHIRIHRAVAKAFIPNPQKLPEVNHKNEIKTDNRVSNLEWCSHKYNMNYGTRNRKVAEAQRQKVNSKRIPIIITLPNGEEKYAHSLREAEEITGWSKSTIAKRLKNPNAKFDRRAIYQFRYASNKKVQSKSIEKYSQNELDRRHQRTYQSIVNELKEKRPNILLLSGYQGVNKQAHFRCLKCKHEFNKTPKEVLTQKYGCEFCARQASAQQRAKSITDAKKDIKKYLYDNLKLANDYKKASDEATFICKHCGKKFKGKLTQILHNAKKHGYISNGCQHCSKRRTATINNMTRVGKTTAEINKALHNRGLDWCPYNE